MIRVYKGIQMGMNLYEAVQKSRIINVKKNANIYYGIQLKSIVKNTNWMLIK